MDRLWAGDSRKEKSAQITRHFSPISVVGRKVSAAVNFPTRQVSKLMPNVLALGFPGDAGEIVPTPMDQPVANGARLF